MSILLYLFKSWVIGIAIAAPVGPIGMLCIKKTLELGIKAALLVGLGAALADSVYGLIAALGLTAISSIMVENSFMLRLAGGILLLYLAYKEAIGMKVNNAACVKGNTPIGLIIGVFFLTVSNPMTILSFIGIFSSINTGPLTTLESITMVLGVFLGSMTWWCVLGISIHKIKHKLPKIWLERIKWVSCFILASFGLMAIFSSLIY